MKTIHFALLSYALFAASFANAAAPSDKAIRFTHVCNVDGCVVRCLDSKTNQWYVLDKASKFVQLDNYPNGNVLYVMEDGVNGVRTHLISPPIQCSVTGMNN